MEFVIQCKTADYLTIDKLEEFQGTLKRRTKKDIQKIIDSIEIYGFSFPFFVWSGSGHNYVLDGHGRLLALSELRKRGVVVPPMPVVFVEAKDEADAKQKLLRLNSNYGDMSLDSVKVFMGDLKIEASEINLPNVNFDSKKNEIGKNAQSEYLKTYDDKIEMYNDTPIFKKQLNNLEIPILRESDYGDIDFSKTIGVYKNRKFEINLNIPGAAAIDETLENIMCFYTDDERFENMFSSPGFCLDLYKKKNIKQIIAPNFSMYTEWPLIVRLYGLYKSRFSSRYMADGGLKIIPDLQIHNDEYGYFMDTIEPGIPCAAVQFHTTKKNALIQDKLDCLKKAIKDLRIEKILCYTDNSFKLDDYIDSAEIKNVLSFAIERFNLKGKE